MHARTGTFCQQGTSWLRGSDEQLCLGLLFPAWKCMLSRHLLKSLSHSPFGEEKTSVMLSWQGFLPWPAHTPPHVWTLCFSLFVTYSYGGFCYPLKGAEIQPHFSQLHNLCSSQGNGNQSRHSFTRYQKLVQNTKTPTISRKNSFTEVLWILQQPLW